MIWLLIFIPFVSAFVGWFVIYIAIKWLFHPKKISKIVGISLQGIFPKRKEQFAAELGKLISSELFSSSQLEQRSADPANIEKILPFLETHIDIFLREKLAAEIPMLGMLIGEKTISQVKGVFMKELKEILPGLIQQYMFTLLQNVNIEKIVIEKVANFSSGETEAGLNRMLSNELRYIKIIGAVAGFIIGLIQVVITFAAAR